ncbi:Beta-hydroxyacyl-(acyl-carrier-protein) dehydratase FabA/FabZ [Isosphaera pallida ATCC 43644]|jgi:3-hydroxyacyl-[acyl-carrier-protein] dehydratase|uniref:Beta-hydroxyacyl-(Acyl-carrier-protein) dehydratase FabA/FabZ n=1 Tax=Isosphaera pallida (strain ATCC 43644 / DSM 9630 / IS1B) TaxID=575540 RepID=E8QZI7_ISOPI|nr:3-hydroxyacyl-ACP dehydratase FabZ family protein [Isosphaera pallida]ADV61114.1 Beta-hydroxyacyl-(acyl-carrier-protein) dehydratase FabA/FabZ [Isosphaera pallida ATCC 43644]
MRFVLLDQILESQPGVRLTAVKNLSLAEEYLADHFPGFPVLPGVLMVEALAQAGSWLVRETDNFAHSLVTLKQARTFKFGSFVEPGRQLRLEVDMADHGPRDTVLKVKGFCEGSLMVQGRITLTRSNLSESDPDLRPLDEQMITELRALYAVLKRRPSGASTEVT